MSKKNQNSISTPEEDAVIEKFNSFFNNANINFKHTYKDVSIFIEGNKLFTPKNKKEEEAILDFAGSNASVFHGKSVITNAGREKISIEGSEFYKSQITTLEAELVEEREKARRLERQLKEVYSELAEEREKARRLEPLQTN